MSWGLFKLNVIRKTGVINSNTVKTVAKVWAEEYDAAVKRGIDFINFESIQVGNKQIMETLFFVALLKGMSSPSDKFSLVNEFGSGVKAYWAGASMKPFPIPLIPAPGSIQNLIVNSNIVTNVGTWPMYPPIKPVSKQEILVDMFIIAALIHLFSIGGIIQTTSLYPSAPTPIPAPGIIPWTGYIVPPTIPIPNINYPSDDNTEPPVIEIPEADIITPPTNENGGDVDSNDGSNDGQDDGSNDGVSDTLGGNTSLQNVINVTLPDMSVDSFDVRAYIASFQQQLEDDGCCCD
jgi:hypothetical protein|tara:strand:- start:611 stop:1486 length:876 start_codon:yes stop_codon:yes gene_type:complete